MTDKGYMLHITNTHLLLLLLFEVVVEHLSQSYAVGVNEALQLSVVQRSDLVIVKLFIELNERTHTHMVSRDHLRAREHTLMVSRDHLRAGEHTHMVSRDHWREREHTHMVSRDHWSRAQTCDYGLEHLKT